MAATPQNLRERARRRRAGEVPPAPVPSPVEELSAQEFFARDLPGCSMHAAHLATRIAYSTVHDIASGKCTPRASTVKRLVAWSRQAGAPHGVCISGSRTLDLDASERTPTGTEG